MIWRIGTMGWGYDDWVDAFYPRGLPQGRWIEFYGRHFDTVEIDSTFYAIPPAGRLRRWADLVPESFRFSLKTPRLITHELEPQQAIEPMRDFVRVARELGEKLGVVLIQFGPAFKPGAFEGLRALLASLPSDMRFAVELRDPNWWTEATAELLASYRIAWVIGDYDGQPLPLYATSDWLYVRWIGMHGRYDRHTAEQQDRSARLAWWQRTLSELDPRVREVWGYVSNDFAGFAIGTANRVKKLLGQEVKPISSTEQGTLF